MTPSFSFFARFDPRVVDDEEEEDEEEEEERPRLDPTGNEDDDVFDELLVVSPSASSIAPILCNCLSISLFEYSEHNLLTRTNFFFMLD